ncbi:esterase-like activity of phytase family protein [Paremcibacter congregatus]|uniref:Phytase-like domain-containing protein n=1 Tax=Paremcibacter congregatus TaxID=2043170 RepID=A0A2G4YQ20_9PROT|nr:esterase-like activity of phytase family protein [Paremcibacter congregatus]PHZ84397.1 hypothetical protein CRD36_11305 [Paremcibacter congregatus]QDE28615.1 esterase-like activity of phytase family protein [Paremcibacter congregatus]|tara:strand:+ start:6286 stop:7401 length:1116 start_codon:yes stop_codon:yes gene_type:complete
MRTRIATLLGLWALFLTPSVSASAEDIALAYIGQQVIPHGFMYKDTTVGGLSALDYNPVTGRYVAISDDRSDRNPARFYELELTFDETGFPGWHLVDRHFIRRPDGSFFPRPTMMGETSVDPEALKLAPGGQSYFWTSEGHAQHRVAPFIREMALDGRYIRDLSLPAKYLLNDAGSNGVRDNLAFEALTINRDGKSLTVSTEGPLVQDAAEATAGHGAPVRFLTLDIATGKPVAEHIYPVSPVHRESLPFGNFSVNGVVAILALDQQKYIVMERSFSTGAGLSVKLYLADMTAATDVLALDSLAGQTVTAAEKTLLLDLGSLGIAIDNLEGMAFGKPLDDGRRTVLLISDDNFRAAQITQILAFVVEGETR